MDSNLMIERSAETSYGIGVVLFMFTNRGKEGWTIYPIIINLWGWQLSWGIDYWTKKERTPYREHITDGNECWCNPTIELPK